MDRVIRSVNRRYTASIFAHDW